MKRIPALLIAVFFAALIREAGADEAANDEPSPAAEISRRIDALFEQAWQAAGVQPAPLADDSAFLRRVTLDLTGVIPEIGEARDFQADNRPDKRIRRIAELLDRPQHAAHMAGVWRELLLPKTVPDSTAAGFESWLQSQFVNNEPYDKIVREILLARGTLNQSPQTLFYSALNTKPSELAASASKAFLGVQIRCAECHDHPFASWRQEEFWGLAAFFAQTRGPSQEGGQPNVDDVASGEVTHPKTMETIAPRLLLLDGDGAEIAVATKEPRRAVFARWVTATENPYFATAAANRVWHLMFGRGLVDPVDDLGEHSTATHPAVLELLCEDFKASGYNLNRLFEIVAATRVYQLASKSGSQTKDDANDLWRSTYTAMPVRSLSARQIYNCLLLASGTREPIDLSDAQVAQRRAMFLEQLDAPTRKPTEFQGGIPQTLTMMNGDLLRSITDPVSGDRVAALVDSRFLSDADRVEAIYLAALTRLPDADEKERSLEWIRVCTAAGDKAQGLSDVLWALLNSSEFILQR